MHFWSPCTYLLKLIFHGVRVFKLNQTLKKTLATLILSSQGGNQDVQPRIGHGFHPMPKGWWCLMAQRKLTPGSSYLTFWFPINSNNSSPHKRKVGSIFFPSFFFSITTKRTLLTETSLFNSRRTLGQNTAIIKSYELCCENVQTEMNPVKLRN